MASWLKIVLCDNSALIFQARDLLEIMFQKDVVSLAFWAREVSDFNTSFAREGGERNEGKPMAINMLPASLTVEN